MRGGLTFSRRQPRSPAGAVVVVTGASSGIGRACAEAFARHDAWLVLAARRPEPLQPALAACEASGAQAIAIPIDVASEEQVIALARRAVERFGGSRCGSIVPG